MLRAAHDRHSVRVKRTEARLELQAAQTRKLNVQDKTSVHGDDFPKRGVSACPALQVVVDHFPVLERQIGQEVHCGNDLKDRKVIQIQR